jgi:hypothetical protein
MRGFSTSTTTVVISKAPFSVRGLYEAGQGRSTAKLPRCNKKCDFIFHLLRLVIFLRNFWKGFCGYTNVSKMSAPVFGTISNRKSLQLFLKLLPKRTLI